MARYFFNLTNGVTVRDTDGEECLDLDSAKALAVQTAHDFARNKRTPEIAGVCLCVTNADGKEVFRTPLAQ